MPDPNRPPSLRDASSRVHESLRDRSGQPRLEPAPDFVERVMDRLDGLGGEDPAREDPIRTHRGPIARRGLAVAAGFLAAIALAWSMRLGSGADPRPTPSPSLAGLEDVFSLPSSVAALTAPEDLLAREWAAVVHDTRALLEQIGSLSPRH